jgi:protein-disulfide isomerase
MTTTAWQRDKNWMREAQAAGVPDTVAFAVCVVGRAGADRIERTMALADSLGVTATPWFLGKSGAFRPGALTLADLSNLK